MDEFEINISDRNRRRRARTNTHIGNDTESDMAHRSTYTPAYERVVDTKPDTNTDTTTPEEDTPTMAKPIRKSHRKPADDSTEKSSTDTAIDPDISMPLIRNKSWRIFLGTVCGLIGVVLVMMLLSHLRNGAHDQSAVTSLSVEQMAATPGSTDNIGGSLGAWLSNALFTDALGLGSIVLTLYLWFLAAGFFGVKRIKFWSLTFKSLLLAITVSIVVGLVTFNAQTTISLGGTHGHEVNAYLLHIGGPIIAGALSILLVVAVVCVYLNDLICFAHKCAELRRRYRLTRVINRDSASENVSTNDTSTVDTSVSDNSETPADDGYAETSEDTTTADTIKNAPMIVNSSKSATSKDEGFSIDPDPEQAGTGEASFTVDTPQVDKIDDGKAIADTSGSGVYSDHRAILPGYSFPTLELLKDIPQRISADPDELQHNKDRIEKALADHKITIDSIKATVGPTVTLYEIVPSEGIRIAQIKRLEDDIALSLAASHIRIIAPMPGKGTVGIEVPNNDPQTVSIRAVLSSKKFREYDKPLPIALGATISNDIFVADLASMPHVLVAGATGQGKSVGLNVIIASLLYKKHPTELKFVLIDPKEVEFSLYNKLEKHYLAKLPGEESAIVTDFEKVLMVLNSLCVEMDTRYGLLREAGVRDITEYNRKFEKGQLNPDYGHHYLPYIVVVIDEFADLIMTAGKEIEIPVTRITQKARAIGIHMVIATQRPSTNVLTGLIKSNCPARIAFRTFQMVDSRVILDRPGANQLIGRGDMLYSQSGEPVRVQCAFISTDEVDNIVNYIFNQTGFTKAYELPEPKLSNDDHQTGGYMGAGTNDRDPLFDECARFIITQSTASTSSLQRRFQIGYNRAGKIIDQMEACGIVGPASGNKPRQIKMDAMELERVLSQR